MVTWLAHCALGNSTFGSKQQQAFGSSPLAVQYIDIQGLHCYAYSLFYIRDEKPFFLDYASRPHVPCAGFLWLRTRMYHEHLRPE